MATVEGRVAKIERAVGGPGSRVAGDMVVREALDEWWRKT